MLYYNTVLFCDTDWAAGTWLVLFLSIRLPPSSGLHLRRW